MISLTSGTHSWSFWVYHPNTLAPADIDVSTSITTTVDVNEASAVLTVTITKPATYPTGKYRASFSTSTLAAGDHVEIEATATVNGQASTGKILDDLADVTTSSRASQTTADAILVDTGTDIPATLVTIAGYVDTEVAAIKAKTDLIPASPASETTLAALVAKFVGITLVARWLGALAGKTADTSTRTEINATTAGATYNETTDALEAVRDRGDTAWVSDGSPTAVQIADATYAKFSGLAPNRVPAVLSRSRRIIQGDSYGPTAKSFAASVADGGEFPDDLSLYTWACSIAKDTANTNTGTTPIAGTVTVTTATGDTRALAVAVTAAQTASMAIGGHTYLIRGTLISDATKKWSVERGTVEVLEDYT